QPRFRPRIERAAPSALAGEGRGAGDVQDFFASPAARGFAVDTNWALDLHDGAWDPLIQDGDRVVAATRALGQGRAYAASSPMLFSNQGIRKESNAALVLNILAPDQPRKGIAFEEYHHALLATPDLASAARASPRALALAYAAVAGLLFLIWGGRRFGPA